MVKQNRPKITSDLHKIRKISMEYHERKQNKKEDIMSALEQAGFSVSWDSIPHVPGTGHIRGTARR
ncbi:MAG: hypothetical protein N3A54_02140 [Patescibacteria group bacterium]|nr:hypothetical protein [Patescibacteria group bacterium]